MIRKKDVVQILAIKNTNMEVLNNQKYRRLATTRDSKLLFASAKLEKVFEKVSIGEIQGEGEIEGCANAVIYNSCKVCRLGTKTASEEPVECRRCKTTDIPFRDSFIDLSVDVNHDEDNNDFILRVFQKDLDFLNDVAPESEADLKHQVGLEMSGKKIKFDADKSDFSTQGEKVFTCVHHTVIDDDIYLVEALNAATAAEEEEEDNLKKRKRIEESSGDENNVRVENNSSGQEEDDDDEESLPEIKKYGSEEMNTSEDEERKEMETKRRRSVRTNRSSTKFGR